MVTANYGSGQQVGTQAYMSVLINNGNGTYGPSTDYNVGENAHPQDVKVGDFNGDNILDIAVAAMWTSRISVFRGVGNGTFTLQGHYPGEAPNYIDVADFTGDGRLDIVYCNVDAVELLRNTGTGFVRGPYINNFPIGCAGITAGDFNGDNAPDFATSGRNLTVFTNTGVGASFTRQYYPVGENPTGIDAADFDNDGHLDIASSNYLANSVSVWNNNGAGGFLPRRDWGVGHNPWGIGIGHLNNDAFVDIVAPNSQLDQTTITPLMNRGDRTFIARRDYGLTGYGRGVEVADFDLDGLPDAVSGVYVSNQDNVAIFFGRSDGTLDDALYLENFGNNIPTDVAVADFNNDGKPDIAASIFSPGNSVRVFRNAGNRDFFNSIVLEAGGNPSGVDAGDITGDGFADIINSNGSQNDNSISVHVNNGNGTFAPSLRIPVLLRPSDVVIADLDMDGDRDVVVTHSDDSRVLIFKNDGDGNLGAPLAFNAGGAQGNAVVADFNGDGNVDIGVAAGTVKLLHGNGNASFGPPINSNVPAGRMDAADFDADGDLDVVGTGLSMAWVGENNGGALALVLSMVSGYETGRVAAADMDADGLPEILTANGRSRSVSVFTNLTNAGRSVLPTSVQVNPGQILSGGLLSLIASDDNRLVVRPGPVFGSFQAPISIIVEGFVPGPGVTSLKAIIESSGTALNVTETVEAYNFTAGTFDLVSTPW